MKSSSSRGKRATSYSSHDNERNNRPFTRQRGATTQRQAQSTNLPYLPSSSRFPSSRPASSNSNSFNYDPESESQIREREDHDDLNQVIMAIDVNSNGTVGCTYYMAKEEKLHLLQDVKTGGDAVIDSR
jgi:DNA mismatch repair protein MSH5